MALLCLQYGDGFTNLLAPTSVNLLACLAFAKVSMKEWYKLIVPVYSILFVAFTLNGYFLPFFLPFFLKKEILNHVL